MSDDWPDEVHPSLLFDTPEEAALAGWAETPSAQAHVDEVRPQQDGSVLVVVRVNGHRDFHDRDACTCFQQNSGKWWCSGSSGW